MLVVGLYVAAACVLFPVTVLIFLTVLIFNPLAATIYAVTGVVSSGLVGWFIGSLLGKTFVAQFTGSRGKRAYDIIAQRGVIAVAILRHIPVAPFTVMNIIIGSAGISMTQFSLGTALGMAPGIAVLSMFQYGLKELFKSGDPVLAAAAGTLVLCSLFIAWLLQRIWRRRRS